MLAGLLAVCGCAPPTSGGNPFTKTGGAPGSSTGTGGVTGSGGSLGSGGTIGSGGSGTGSSGAQSGGSIGTGGSGGDRPGTGGDAGGSPDAGVTGSGGMSGTGGAAAGTGGVAVTGSGGRVGTGGTSATGGAGGTVGTGDDITKVVPTIGCGKAPGQAIGMFVAGTINTMGTKAVGCADSVCGAWSYQRQYYVSLPQGYDSTKAYPLVFQGPGCGAIGTNVYPLPNAAGNVIRVGLTPPPNAIGHATNPGQGCFDDKEGDDSVDWVFYENLYDNLAGRFCFDKNRVFASGNSSGAWLSNEVGCKYAGDASRPMRAIMPNTGGLPTDVRYVPTCTTKPMAGMWIHETGDTTNPFTGNKVAIARAMRVNGCTIGTTYDNTMFDAVTIPGVTANTCKKIRGCPALYPLVICELPGTAHGSHDNIANPGFAWFINMFSMPPLLTP